MARKKKSAGKPLRTYVATARTKVKARTAKDAMSKLRGKRVRPKIRLLRA